MATKSKVKSATKVQAITATKMAIAVAFLGAASLAAAGAGGGVKPCTNKAVAEVYVSSEASLIKSCLGMQYIFQPSFAGLPPSAKMGVRTFDAKKFILRNLTTGAYVNFPKGKTTTFTTDDSGLTYEGYFRGVSSNGAAHFYIKLKDKNGSQLCETNSDCSAASSCIQNECYEMALPEISYQKDPTMPNGDLVLGNAVLLGRYTFIAKPDQEDVCVNKLQFEIASQGVPNGQVQLWTGVNEPIATVAGGVGTHSAALGNGSFCLPEGQMKKLWIVADVLSAAPNGVVQTRMLSLEGVGQDSSLQVVVDKVVDGQILSVPDSGSGTPSTTPSGTTTTTVSIDIHKDVSFPDSEFTKGSSQLIGQYVVINKESAKDICVTSLSFNVYGKEVGAANFTWKDQSGETIGFVGDSLGSHTVVFPNNNFCLPAQSSKNIKLFAEIFYAHPDAGFLQTSITGMTGVDEGTNEQFSKSVSVDGQKLY